MQATIEPTAPPAELRPKPEPMRWYALAVFTLVYTMINIDRGILSVMIEPIKKEFHLNDSQVGLLTGIAFALFFGIAGIPFGRWTDRGNRKTVLGVSLLLFSLMTAACGLAGNFVHLLLARMVVGAGEAGGGPTTISMTSDYFPPERRATAISIYYLGSPLGQMITLFFGGMIISAYGWRSGFLAAGGLGLLLLTLIVLTLPEPQRRNQAGGLAGEAPPFRRRSASSWASPR